MQFEMTVLFLIAALVLGLLVTAELGRRLGLARLREDPDGLPKGISASEGAVFALLGLLLAFTFSGAASRFEERRHLVTAETNAIGTAYLRIDLLPQDARDNMRERFRRYVDARLATYSNVQDRAATAASLAEDEALQREAATRNHPPAVIFILLVGLSLIGALMVGYGTSVNRGRTWLHTVAFAAILSLTIYVIVDLEFPRLGLIRVDAADQVLVDLRASMK
jgi:hypothetical protein